MRRLKAAILVALATLGTACSGLHPSASGEAIGGGACASVDTTVHDALSAVCSSGDLWVVEEQDARPGSWFDVATLAWRGFDVDVAQEIATRLGVSAAIVPRGAETVRAPTAAQTASLAPMTVTVSAEQRNAFTPPYAYVPVMAVVRKGSPTIRTLSELNGERICVGASTSAEAYLSGALDLPKSAGPVSEPIADPQIVTFPTEAAAVQGLWSGTRCDAAMATEPTINGAVADGEALETFDQPAFFQPIALAIAKGGSLDTQRLVAEVGSLLEDMRADGTLGAMSRSWYGADYSRPAEPSATPTATASASV
ncbi:MAG: substrate-binding periplasmic protein [Actinomycetota bacterium]